MNGRRGRQTGRYRLDLAGQRLTESDLTGQDRAGLRWAGNCAVRSSGGMKAEHDAGERKLMRKLLAFFETRCGMQPGLLRVYQPGAGGSAE
jgi:hypothetical protein